MYQALQKSRNNLMVLLGIRRQGLRLYTHCLQVSMLGMAFAKYLGWTGDKARDFGLGCMIHDIGIARVPQEILDKPGPLTEEEMAKIRRHPLEGFRMLQKIAQLRWEALQMIRQHHENCDGDGYPEGLRLAAIHPWARVLRIVDSYEAMTAERPWRPAMDPKKALWTMRSDWEKNKLYDANLLRAFFKFLAAK
jgi:HD-GYP domain-containing protein (c-di-GMP phosphodiesterase class II)